MQYVAIHVDLQGVAKEAYDLKATDDEQAREEARKYLNEQQTIEVWHGPRRVVRLVRL